jgi:protoporphyrinogen oxidase
VSSIAVLGSGMAALGAAHRLRQEGASYVMFDKGSHPGGHTKTYVYPGDWVFDDGPHVSFTSDERIQEILASQIDGDFNAVPTGVNNYWQGYWVKHPAQCNLHGLPTDLVVSCIEDFVEVSRGPDPDIATYEDWLYASYGRSFADNFPMLYTRKVHTTEARNLTADWMGPRMYRPELEEVLRGALSPQTPEVHYIDRFRYPMTGGFYSYLRPIHESSDLRMDHEVVRIVPHERVLEFANGRREAYSGLVSSIPLPVLVPMIDGVPPDVLDAVSALAATSCVIVNVGIDRVEESGNSWTYIYDEDFLITRISYPHRYAPGNVPEGCSAFQCEIYFSDKYRPMTEPAEAFIEPAIEDLRRCGLVEPGDKILLSDAKLSPYAGIIFDHDRPSALSTVHGFLDEHGIRYCGRYGDWAYLWTDHSFTSGEGAAQLVLDGR